MTTPRFLHRMRADGAWFTFATDDDGQGWAMSGRHSRCTTCTIGARITLIEFYDLTGA